MMVNFVTTLRSNYARMLMGFYRKHKVEGGNRWVVIDRGASGAANDDGFLDLEEDGGLA